MKKILIKTTKYLLIMLVIISSLFTISCSHKKKVVITAIDSGRILAMNNGLYGYIDKFGHEAIPFKFINATPFSNGRAVVSETGTKYYMINNKGKKISSDYDKLLYCSDDKVVVATKGKEVSLLSLEGKELVKPNTFDQIGPFNDGISCVSRNNLFGLINIKGDYIIKLKYAYLDLYFSCNLLLAYDGNKYGYINKNDEVVLPFIYDSATSFDNDLAIVTLDGEKKIIDTKGNIIWQPDILSEERFIALKEGYIITNDSIGINVYNKSGKLILDEIIDVTSQFTNYFHVTDEFIVYCDLVKTYFYKLDGTYLAEVDKPYLKILYDLDDYRYYYVLWDDNKHYEYYRGRLNVLLKLDIDEDYELAEGIEYTFNGCFIVKFGSGIGVINESSKVQEKFIYEDFLFTSEGYKIFKINGYYGLMNSYDLVYIEPKFEKLIAKIEKK